MPNFKPLNYNQNSLVIINYLDQLQAGTFEYAIHYLIDTKLDLTVFYPKYKNDDKGAQHTIRPRCLKSSYWRIQGA